MDVTLFENSCWSGNDGLYYKIYSISKHAQDITGFIRKSVDNTSIGMDTTNDFQYEFTITHAGKKCKIKSELFVNTSQILFDLQVSTIQIEISMDGMSQLILTRIECPE